MISLWSHSEDVVVITKVLDEVTLNCITEMRGACTAGGDTAANLEHDSAHQCADAVWPLHQAPALLALVKVTAAAVLR